MPLNSALALADARLFVEVINALANQPEGILSIIAPLVPISKSAQISYTTNANILRALLVHVSPIAVGSAEISELASIIVSAEQSTELSENDLVEDAENLTSVITQKSESFSSIPEDAVLQIADDLRVNLATKAYSLSFTINEDSEILPAELLFQFAKARCLHMALYFEDVTTFAESFTLLKEYGPFEKWYSGVIRPYHYFYSNFSKPTNTSATEIFYLSLTSNSDIFQFLVKPLESPDESLQSKLVPRTYLSNVLLPSAVYHDCDLSPLCEWMLGNLACATLSDFALWDEVLRTILSYHDFEGKKLPSQGYEKIVRLYIESCTYFGLCTGEKLTSSDQGKIQSQIRDTLSYLVDMIGSTSSSMEIAPESIKMREYDSLSDFVERPPDLLLSILESSLGQCLDFVLRVYTTCCLLHALNSLTVKRFFELKARYLSHDRWFHKEIMQLLSGANSSSYDQIMDAISVFSDSFLLHDEKTVRQLDELVFGHFIQTESFEKALQYHSALPQGRSIFPEFTFKAISGKFWELFENASNLDDRIGKLRTATRCLEILDNISKVGGLAEEKREVVVRIKHLLKAIHSLKNFKLVIEKNLPVTPKQILNKLSLLGSDEQYPSFAIISMVLEQNPKSYLAHERLYKIVNDLAIYSDSDLSAVSYPRIQSACVESALIDGNFDFAYKQTKALITFYIESGNTDSFSDVWLMFYQVGKFISPEWFGDYDANVQEKKIKVLLKQREVLSLAIKHTKPIAFKADNSRLLVGQFRHVNSEIKKWHEEADLHRSEEVQDAFLSAQKQVQENFTDLINEASHSKNQASEKISNLFVSGLGWAIGAKR